MLYQSLLWILVYCLLLRGPDTEVWSSAQDEGVGIQPATSCLIFFYNVNCSFGKRTYCTHWSWFIGCSKHPIETSYRNRYSSYCTECLMKGRCLGKKTFIYNLGYKDCLFPIAIIATCLWFSSWLYWHPHQLTYGFAETPAKECSTVGCQETILKPDWRRGCFLCVMFKAVAYLYVKCGWTSWKDVVSNLITFQF